ncbi:MAG: acyl-CoA dehydrogenase family protein [Deltaproteobacteria bacterium]|nr:MAG: acyl-CoA dehydrogenase family protein [Deltaproteobacteria bacterium]
MDNLIRILRSFSEGEEDRTFTDNFVDLLKDKVMTSVEGMYEFGLKFQNNKAIFPPPWESIYASLKEIGFFKRFVPVDYGGTGASEENIYFIMELLGYTCPSLGIIFVAHGRAVDLILAGKDEALKSRFLSRLGDGDFGAIAMTEERAGTDASAIEFSAKRKGGYYIFHGEKIFISNAGLARVYTILVNTKGVKGARSLSVFVVEDEIEGFRVDPLPEKDGLKILPTGKIIYENCLIPKENLIGDEGKGLLLALDAIDRGRILLAGIACGLACRILDEIFEYSRKRIQFDHPLTSSQDISFKMSDMYTQINAARGLCFHALKQVHSPYYRSASSQAKLFATQMVMSVAQLGLMIMGGRGYFKNNIISMLSADARGMEYLEGTSSIQKMIISRELFKSYS